MVAFRGTDVICSASTQRTSGPARLAGGTLAPRAPLPYISLTNLSLPLRLCGRLARLIDLRGLTRGLSFGATFDVQLQLFTNGLSVKRVACFPEPWSALEGAFNGAKACLQLLMRGVVVHLDHESFPQEISP